MAGEWLKNTSQPWFVHLVHPSSICNIRSYFWLIIHLLIRVHVQVGNVSNEFNWSYLLPGTKVYHKGMNIHELPTNIIGVSKDNGMIRKRMVVTRVRRWRFWYPNHLIHTWPCLINLSTGRSTWKGVTAQVENTRLARKFLVGPLKMTVHNMMYRYGYLRLS